ncbi:hypothetical protein RJ639_022659 [Escallonia herrerae]|uniref:Uncharacterized protein n=1 Tax=Escallonia herrerae TaxID=1293975 RepID=A0AA88V0B3_9ASTE|nr:hypothetical protein RJ639_022659 [Escallonia herrerae]
MLAHKKVRPIRENDIIFGEALFNCRWRGYDKNGAGTKSKGEYRTKSYEASIQWIIAEDKSVVLSTDFCFGNSKLDTIIIVYVYGQIFA